MLWIKVHGGPPGKHGNRGCSRGRQNRAAEEAKAKRDVAKASYEACVLDGGTARRVHLKQILLWGEVAAKQAELQALIAQDATRGGAFAAARNALGVAYAQRSKFTDNSRGPHIRCLLC